MYFPIIFILIKDGNWDPSVQCTLKSTFINSTIKLKKESEEQKPWKIQN